MFGRRKPKYVAPAPQPQAPPPQQAALSVDNAVHNATMRQRQLEARLQKCESEIEGLKKDYNRCRPGTAQHGMYKRRLLTAMRERKRLNQQIGFASNQEMNLKAMQDARASLENIQRESDTMRQAKEEMQGQMRHVNVDAIQDTQDDVREALVETQDMEELLGQDIVVDGGIDEAEFEAELEDEGISTGYAQDSRVAATPSYLPERVGAARSQYSDQTTVASPQQRYAPNQPMRR